jgi:hypothetical protein
MRFPSSTRLARTALAGAALLSLAACGGAGYHGDGDPYYPPFPASSALASAELDNLSFEYVLGFYMAPAATSSWSGDLLSSPLPPGFVESLGEFDEDFYDAEADLELGDLVQWFDVFLPGAELTTFEVY